MSSKKVKTRKVNLSNSGLDKLIDNLRKDIGELEDEEDISKKIQMSKTLKTDVRKCIRKVVRLKEMMKLVNDTGLTEDMQDTIGDMTDDEAFDYIKGNIYKELGNMESNKYIEKKVSLYVKTNALINWCVSHLEKQKMNVMDMDGNSISDD